MREEYLSRDRFITALVREYRSAYDKRDALDLGNAGYLEIEIKSTTDRYQLIMRGNEFPSQWYIHITKYQCSVDGLKAAHQEASEIMFEAVQKLSEILGEPVSIGIKPVSFFHGWFTEATKTN
jgi:hypothetical protein